MQVASPSNVHRARALPEPAALLQLLKPVTWFPPMWALACGFVSAGEPLLARWPFVLGAVLLAGPFMCGTSQVVNDWFDRHVDAINEPQRPIPSGRVPGSWGLYFAIGWSVVSLGVAYALGTWIFIASSVGMVLAWMYSAPPFRLKENGWLGATAVGFSYESLPWFTGAAVLTVSFPDPKIMLLALAYGVGAFGILVTNDFKALEGDRKLGVKSVPVLLGVKPAAWLAVVVMILPQVVVVGALLFWGRPIHAAIIGAFIAAQIGLAASFVRDPRGRDVWFNATGIPLSVLGMMVAALAVRTLGRV